MQEQYYFIGEAAGKIYRILENKGTLTATQLQKETGITEATLFNQALGWLAREEKIGLSKSGKTLKISLCMTSVW